MRSEDHYIEKVERRTRGLGWWLFRFPGSLFLWIQYYFPDKGRVLVSARQRGNPLMEVVFTLAFYGMILMFFYIRSQQRH